MNCGDVQNLLHPYSDGELDLVRRVQIEEHLCECPACAEQDQQLRSLRAAISPSSLYYRAPAALRAQIERAVPSAGARRRKRLRLAAVAAGVLLLIGTTATIGMRLSQMETSADDRLAEWVVAAHVRSLQVDHLTDVASSDRHSVKPWFRGQLDYSPQVPDLSGQGYILSGGRLDYLADRPVAALVYHHRLHAINVFTWPAVNDQRTTVREVARQGFHVRYWERSGMKYWAISDLNDRELDEFVRLFQERFAAPDP
jgi:anti-sigma factor RsiW